MRLNDPSDKDKVGFGPPCPFGTALVEWHNRSLVLVFIALGNSLGLEIKQEINLLSAECKNSHSILRCRRCNACWKLHASQSHLFRCLEFLSNSCPHADEVCRRIHVPAQAPPARAQAGIRGPGVRGAGECRERFQLFNPPILVPAPWPCTCTLVFVAYVV
ncbi:hypothetical protein DIPPA_27180 [Diplonema papillatum]|nr:hypothetical protein DIPPA_27180 [Diplonema papillatum]